MAIECGVALATILKHWKTDKNPDLGAAFQFYQDLRKPRTDRVTETSYEAGKLASADSPDQLDDKFNPEAIRDRMRWITECDVLEDIRSRNASCRCLDLPQDYYYNRISSTL